MADEGYFANILKEAPPLNSFDAFKKTNASYKERTTKGGMFTLAVLAFIVVLVLSELRQYLYGDLSYTFSVEDKISHQLQLNVDILVAMPCHYLTVDVRDAVGDRLHISDEFKKDGTEFSTGHAVNMKKAVRSSSSDQLSASKMVKRARRGRKKNRKFPKTTPLLPEGPACRIYGNVDVKKVTGNLHITTLGHGYLSWEHTDHGLMNLSHVIHEFSFGPYFPDISQPLDESFEVTDAHFHIYQYFLSVVGTTYIAASKRIIQTHQYSVTEMSRVTEHGKGVPGIFFKFDMEPMALTIRERTTTLLNFLVRLSGIVGGVVVCADFAFRTVTFFYEKLFGRRAFIPTNSNF